jgi:hypothetical protein
MPRLMGAAEYEPNAFRAYASSVVWLPPETRIA